MTGLFRKLAAALVLSIILSCPLLPAVAEDGADIINAVRANDTKTVSTIAAINPALLQTAEKDGTTLVHMAVSSGNNKMLKLLLEAMAPADKADKKGTTALHIAAFADNTDAVLMLLDRGADIEKKDKAGWNALYIAQAMGYRKLVVLLLNRGAKDDIFAAAAAGDYEWVKASIKKDPTIIEPLKDSNFSLLHIAATAGQDKVVRLLLDHGARINALTTEGSPLTLAALMGKKDTVLMLIKAGADTETTDANGLTPLHWAAASGYKDIVSILIKAQADPTRLTNDGKSAKDLAAAAGHNDIAAILDNSK